MSLFPIRPGAKPLRPEGTVAAAVAVPLLPAAAPTAPDALDADWNREWQHRPAGDAHTATAAPAKRGSKKGKKDKKKHGKKDKKGKQKHAATKAAPKVYVAADSGNEARERELVERTQRYVSALARTPKDVALWMEYAESVERDGRHIARSAVVEKKLAVYERALRENAHDTALYLRYLACAQELWEPAVMFSTWQSVVRKYSHSLTLWRAFVHYVRASYWSVATFTVVGARKLYAEALASLLAYRATLTTVQAELESFLVQLLVEMVTLEAQAGYTERAVALVQAMVEFNAVADNGDTYSERLFGFYWESEAPRVGEERCSPVEAGFLTWLREGGGAAPSQPAGVDALLSAAKWSHHAPPVAQWPSDEMQVHLSRSCVPLRSQEGLATDPDATVCFDDVAPFLFRCSSAAQLAALGRALVLLMTGEQLAPHLCLERVGLPLAVQQCSFFAAASGAQVALRLCQYLSGAADAFEFSALQLQIVARFSGDLTQVSALAASLLQSPQLQSNVRMWLVYADCMAAHGTSVEQARKVFANVGRLCSLEDDRMMVCARNALLEYAAARDAQRALAVLPSYEELRAYWNACVGESRCEALYHASVALCLAEACRGTLSGARLREVVQTAVEASLLAPRCARDAVFECYAQLLHLFDAVDAPQWLLETYEFPSALAPRANSPARVEQCLLRGERQSEATWEHYMEVVALDAERAQRVAMRAVRAMPWSKRMWMALLRRVHDAADSVSLIDLMEEKLLRITCRVGKDQE